MPSPLSNMCPAEFLRVGTLLFLLYINELPGLVEKASDELAGDTEQPEELNDHSIEIIIYADDNTPTTADCIPVELCDKIFWPRRLACAMCACVRHACAMHSLAIVITIVQSALFSLSFSLSVLCF